MLGLEWGNLKGLPCFFVLNFQAIPLTLVLFRHTFSLIL